jgi:phenylacetate-CoA ligase
VLLGGECSYSRSYHLFPSYGVAEIVNEDGEIIKEPGRVGRLLGTGLLNLSAPLVRYDTGDLAVWADGPCACGFTGQRLDRVIGRSQDSVRTSTGASISIAALNLHSHDYDAVEQLQYVQQSPGRVLLRIVPRRTWNDFVEASLLESVRARLPGVELTLALVDRIEPERNGKVALVKVSPS